MSELSITKVDFTPITQNNGLIGFATIILNDEYLLEGIGVFVCQEREGYRVTYPKRQAGSKSINVHYPLTQGMLDKVNKAVNEKVTEFYNEMGASYIEQNND